MRSLLSDLGPVTAIIGAQWGDEGKGKVTDILAEHFDIIARACGGANAGHTIVVKGKKHIFQLLPAGSLHEGKPIVLGAGMVIHLPSLLAEIETLHTAGIDIVPRLRISSAAHIVFDYHKAIDAAMEEARGASSIGTTKRGIGPAYMDKAARQGIRIGQLRDDITPLLSARAAFVHRAYGVTIDVRREQEQCARAFSILQNCIIESSGAMLTEAIKAGKTVLIEGAQATLLDIDHGTYPYVTSSATTAAGALQGLGLAPRVLTSCIGIAKAYCTRVGGGEFATEDHGERGERLRKRGGEFGAVTGRPRRCGWLDIPDVRLAAALNGFTALNITKLDVLDEEATIPVGIGRSPDGAIVYETLPGWQTSTSHIQSWTDLPSAARSYIEYIETHIGIPVRMIGTGQDRADVIYR